jgi:hypothetical protein
LRGSGARGGEREAVAVFVGHVMIALLSSSDFAILARLDGRSANLS